MMNHSILLLKAQEHFAAAQYKEAIKCFARLRTNKSYFANANLNIGICLLMMGFFRSALVFIDRALRQDSSCFLSLIDHIYVLQSQQKYEEVSNLCESILNRYPTQDALWTYWIDSLRASYKYQEAIEVVKTWLSHQPTSLEGLLLEAELLSDQGLHVQAVDSLSKAIKISPNSEKVYSHLSVIMMRLRYFEAAILYVDKALKINPNSLSYLCRKAMALWLVGSWRDAALYYSLVAAMRPESAVYFLNQYLIFPGIPSSSEEIQEARQRFLMGLFLAEKNTTLQLNFQDEAIPHTFELAYHNNNDRCLIERYIDLMRKLAKPLLQEIRQNYRQSHRTRIETKDNRLRIGFISRFFSGHSNAIAFSGLIRNLDRNSFEVVLIHAAHSKQDEVRDELSSLCDKVVQLCPDYNESGQALLSLNLDILFFTDIGMNSNEYFLPLVRSAPIQITGWGIPHTSGIREIDYYISAEGLEPSGAEKLYTEHLVQLPCGISCCFETSGLELVPLPREYFFLPPEKTLIGCLQSLHKLHPDFDLLLEKIASQSPDAFFVFVEDSIPSRTQAFLNRLEKNAPSVRERCILLAIMSRSEYHSLSHCIDLLLDPIYYGCGISFFEASFVGTPVVTLEGSALRSRIVSNGYKQMGLGDELIVSTQEEYLNLVTDLCKDRERLSKLRLSILESNHKIFNRIDYVRDFEKFCLSVVNKI